MNSSGLPTRFTPSSFGPIAVASRSGFDETLHHGVGVVVDPAGSVVASIGDPDLSIYPRSALKVFQATAMVDRGLDLPADLLALVAASHSGEQIHLDGVVRILDRYGLAVDQLANTAALPYGTRAHNDARRSGVEPSPLQQNCSGKHAGMLATCRINDWPVDGYLEVDHPLQRAITSTIEQLGATVERVGTDGCGAPTHALSLTETASALGRLVRSGSVVAAAMSEHPTMVGGTDRDVTIWMDAVPNLVAKEGADGVMVLAAADGSAAAFKIADGSDRARQAVTVQALRLLGIDVDGVHRGAHERVAIPVLGHGRRVGALHPLEWTPWTS